jgi:antitoxin YefM
VPENSFDFNRVFWYNKWYNFRKWESIVSITASEARKNLFPLIEQVNENREPIEITSKRGDAVLMSRADFDALNETALLLRSPANARRLLKSLAQANAGERTIHKLS